MSKSKEVIDDDDLNFKLRFLKMIICGGAGLIAKELAERGFMWYVANRLQDESEKSQ